MMARRIILLVAFFLVFGAGFRIYALPAVCGSPDSLTRTEAALPAVSDPFERNDYMAGVNEQDPARQAILLEDFQRRYPESVLRAGALEKTLDAYLRGGDNARAAQTAKRILSVNPGDIRALAILAFIARRAVAEGKSGSAVDVGAYAERGLKALADLRPSQGMRNEDFERMCNGAAHVFYGAAGFSALQSKNYQKARDFYLKAYEIAPVLEDTFQLSMTELEMEPMDVHGFWYLAKAVQLARNENNLSSARFIEDYGRSKYKRYHGGTDGWEELMKGAYACGEPPARMVDTTLFHGIPASITSPANGSLHGVSASVVSPGGNGGFHGVPASVASPTSDGRSHGVPASVTSPVGDTNPRKDQAASCIAGAFARDRGRNGNSAEEWVGLSYGKANQNTRIPRAFLQAIARKPTPEELVCRMVGNTDPATLSLSDWETVLGYRNASSCNRSAAEKVWAAIQQREKSGAGKLKFTRAKVIDIGDNTLDVALTEDNQNANKPDLRISMDAPMSTPPGRGTLIDLAGVIIDYKSEPFMFIAEHGEFGPATTPSVKPAGNLRSAH